METKSLTEAKTMMNLKAVEKAKKPSHTPGPWMAVKNNDQTYAVTFNHDYYCISCKIDMCSTVEAAAHLLGGCIVDSEPSGE